MAQSIPDLSNAFQSPRRLIQSCGPGGVGASVIGVCSTQVEFTRSEKETEERLGEERLEEKKDGGKVPGSSRVWVDARESPGAKKPEVRSLSLRLPGEEVDSTSGKAVELGSS